MTTEPADGVCFVPDWPLPPGVRALQTTRAGGSSAGPWAGFNLGGHVGDDPAAVAANRAALARRLPAAPVWLAQVHGTAVADIDGVAAGAPPPVADAAVARRAGRVCAVMTADCLPLLLCDRDGGVVAAAHAGWRGLCAGVIEATVAAMGVPAARLTVWLGPAIGPRAFEVGGEVRDAFLAHDAAAASAFVAGADGRWLADLHALARQRLAAMGVRDVHGGGECTFGDAGRYFSYRRDGVCGRMATLIWREH
ncbi:MAG: peptidoglycan editing factor PgeF [Rhodocyclaceae bacterium]|nr:peptidoglycan editing factor PgeF [Rhodocyclaceae bacterium]